MKYKVQKIRICFAIHSLQTGGMERVVSELAGQFSKKEKVELHILLYGRSRSVFYDIPENVTIHKPTWKFRDDLRLISSLRTLIWLRRTVSKIKPDTVLSVGEYWNSFVLLALARSGIPVYISDRCQPDKHLGQPHEWLRGRLYPKAAGIIAQTQIAKSIYYQKFDHPNIQIIPNPIREIKFSDTVTDKENIILTVGRLIDTKHHDRLIKIFDRVKRDDWKLIIVGGDAIKQNGKKKLKQLIEEKGLTDRVILTGTVADVEAYYRKSKIFAFTSSSEGFPNVIGEAMSAGLPVIAYDCVAGPSDMIDHQKNGILTEQFDDDAFVKGLRLLMEHEKLRVEFGDRAQKKVTQFSAHSISEKVFDFITKGSV
jgi:glycosyltransferase involved in cell wall biosynthesis